MDAAATPSRRILILGCGYVGTALAERLIAAGHEVAGTTTTKSRFPELADRGIEPLLLVPGDSEGPRAALVDRDAVYLSVAPNRAARTTTPSYQETYVTTARHLAVALPNSHVRQVIYTSSTRVYSQDRGEWVTEQSLANPTDESGRALVETERILLNTSSVPAGDRQPADPVMTTVLRVAGLHGPGRDIVARAQHLAGSTLEGGDEFVNLVHLDDLVSVLAALLDRPYSGLLNVSDGFPLSRRDLYDRIIADHGWARITWRPHEGGAKLGKRVDNRLVRSLLGVRFQTVGPKP